VDRAGMERALENYLGAPTIIWLGRGIEGDDTDGHVDDIARFVSPHRVVCAREKDRSDPNYGVLEENYQRLEAAKDQDGKRLEVIPLPMPGSVVGPTGRLPASYTNFYIANGVVLVPVFGHGNDAEALIIFKEIFHDRKVLGLDCRVLVWGFGGIHCVTQQQPAIPRAVEGES